MLGDKKRMQTRASIFIAILLLSPSNALASYGSSVDGIFIVAAFSLIVPVCAVINAIASCVWLARRKYISKKFLKSHAIITSVGLLIPVVIGLLTIDYSIWLLLGSLIYGLIFIGFPILQYRKHINISKMPHL